MSGLGFPSTVPLVATFVPSNFAVYSACVARPETLTPSEITWTLSPATSKTVLLLLGVWLGERKVDFEWLSTQVPESASALAGAVAAGAASLGASAGGASEPQALRRNSVVARMKVLPRSFMGVFSK